METDVGIIEGGGALNEGGGAQSEGGGALNEGGGALSEGGGSDVSEFLLEDDDVTDMLKVSWLGSGRSGNSGGRITPRG